MKKYLTLFSFIVLAFACNKSEDVAVNEIALQLGYSTSSHFIAAFKRKYKITPKQFAKS